MSQQYVILIREPEWDHSDVTEAEWADMWTQHNAFSAAVAAAGGKVVGGDALDPTTTSFRVSGFGGTPVFTDGPFGETKEIVSGYYQIELPDGADVRPIAALCPTAGDVEVRAVMDLPSQ